MANISSYIFYIPIHMTIKSSYTNAFISEIKKTVVFKNTSNDATHPQGCCPIKHAY